jgi:hypothetical protein
VFLIEKIVPKTLYVNRPLLNAKEVIVWAKKQGFGTTLKPDDMHVTIAYSKTAVDWDKLPKATESKIHCKSSIKRKVLPLGDKGAVVLKFQSQELHDRWQELCNLGCSWDYPTYQSHTTITYEGKGIDLNRVVPYVGPLEFGPEEWAPLDDNWEDKVKEK